MKMLVYFSANHRNIANDLERYREIIDTVRAEGHILINNWIEAANHTWPKRDQNYDWGKICADARVGVDDAELVLSEASGASSFGVGLEVGSAIAAKKKVIILVRSDCVQDSYVSGLGRKDVAILEYTPGTLTPVLRRALKEAAK